MVFNWCMPLLTNMKSQLTSIQKGQTKNFGYGTILCSFFFEKVPGLRPKVSVSISSPRDPQMDRWADLMKCVIYLGGITWGTKGGTQGNNVIMEWAIVINKVVNPYHVRDHK